MDQGPGAIHNELFDTYSADCSVVVQGTANGRILTAPRGTHDFGYDPLFEFTEPGFAVTGRAFAELEPDEKATVNHRARALKALAERLIELG